MLRTASRAIILAACGGLAGVAGLALVFGSRPGVVLDMDRNLPGILSGLYPGERDGRDTFAWTRSLATLRLPGLDRRLPWTCTLRLRGGRPPQFAQPAVTFAADGVALATRTATNEYEDVTVTIPPRNADGLTLTVSSSPVFVPGPSDRRPLGIQLDRISCRPVLGFAMPPGSALTAAAIAGAVSGAGLGALGVPVLGALAGIGALAIGQAIVLAAAPGAYDASYVRTVSWLAFWIALACTVGATAVSRWRRQALPVAARVALAITGGALFLELMALLHPAKLVIDALFHAHRLEWVLAGRYLFTQPMPSGVRFPYAIALYVSAAPWTALTHDYIALLKIVVSVARALAGLALYPMIVRTWRDRQAGVLAVALFHLVPLPFIVIGNANLTYAFGQSMVGLTLAAAATWTLGRRQFIQLAGLVAIASIAFLSHVGIFPIALAVMLATGVLYRLLGGAALHVPARHVLAAAVLAALFSVATYYGHFTDSYRTLARTRAAAASSQSSGQETGATAPQASNPPVMSRPTRIGRAVLIGEQSFGWPIIVMAAAGVWLLATHGFRDRLGLLLAASGLAYLAFVAFSVLAPIDPGFQRYNEEFLSRLDSLAQPVVAILAARGVTWLWRAGNAGRIASVVLLMAAVSVGVTAWHEWLR